MINNNDLKNIASLIDEFKPKPTFFEKEILVPNMIGRLNFSIEIFEEFKAICSEPQLENDINSAAASIIRPNLVSLGAKPPSPGRRYLDRVSKSCEEEFIQPIKKILNEYPVSSTVNDMERTANFLNAAANFFRSVIGVRQKAFLMSIKSTVWIRSEKRGEELVSLPPEATLILQPFETRMAELVNVALTSVQSVEAWGETVSKQKNRHIDMVASLSNVKAAEQTAKSAKYNMYFQVLVIIFALILVLATDRANSYIEKRALENVVAKQELQISSLQKQLNALEVDRANKSP